MKNIFFAILFALPAIVLGQCNASLSQQGAAHVRAAETLAGMATSVKDWQGVAGEYERVLLTDSSYAPVLMTLGDLYARIGNSEGGKAFERAAHFYELCRNACADSAASVTVKLTVLDALWRKYSESPQRFVGVWGVIYENNGEFGPLIDVAYSNGKYLFRLLGNNSMWQIYKTTDNSIYLSRDWTNTDYTDELKKKRLHHYYIDDLHKWLIPDPGYSKYGKVNYDAVEKKGIISFRISEKNNAIYEKFEGMQYIFRLEGEVTFKGIEPPDEDESNGDQKFFMEIFNGREGLRMVKESNL